MTKGIITDNLGEGHYAVSLELDLSYLDGRIEALEQSYVDSLQPLLDAQVAVLDADAAVTAAANAVDALIDAYIGEGQPVPTTAPEMIAAIRVLTEASTERQRLRNDVTRLQSRRTGLAVEINTLKQARAGAQSQAQTQGLLWCADYSTELTGDVGVAVVPGEFSANPLVILPQSREDGQLAGYSRVRDGQLVPPLGMTPEATFVNMALLPGWQRWMPTYRIAEITALDTTADTCSLIIERNQSSQRSEEGQRFRTEIGSGTTLFFDGVPVRYMTCNAAAFEIGDRVLVRFLSNTSGSPAARAQLGEAAWAVSNMEVIGFVSQPRPCDICYFPVPELSSATPEPVGVFSHPDATQDPLAVQDWHYDMDNHVLLGSRTQQGGTGDRPPYILTYQPPDKPFSSGDTFRLSLRFRVFVDGEPLPEGSSIEGTNTPLAFFEIFVADTNNRLPLDTGNIFGRWGTVTGDEFVDIEGQMPASGGGLMLSIGANNRFISELWIVEVDMKCIRIPAAPSPP